MPHTAILPQEDEEACINPSILPPLSNDFGQISWHSLAYAYHHIFLGNCKVRMAFLFS